MANIYALPNKTDTEGIYELFRYVNNTAGGIFFPVIILVIWIIAFVSMLFSGNLERPSSSKAWIFASFVSSILSILLSILGLMASKYMYINFVLLGFGVLWAILENSKE